MSAVKNVVSSYRRGWNHVAVYVVNWCQITTFSTLFLFIFVPFPKLSKPFFNFYTVLRECVFFHLFPEALVSSSAQLLFRFTLLAGHLLAAAVLQLFALVVVRSHFKQPAALYLNHLWWRGEKFIWEINVFILAGMQLITVQEHLSHFLISLLSHSHKQLFGGSLHTELWTLEWKMWLSYLYLRFFCV